MTPGDLPAMLDDLEELVLCESFSADLDAVAASAEVVAALGARHLGARPETIVVDGVAHLRWSFGAPRVLLLGHHDTVWPIGSLRERPWSVTDGVARGPGVFDMKAGLVQMFHALGSLASLDGVCVLVNGDEELGSGTSRALIEQNARACSASLVLEASGNGGALKTARKGTSNYRVTAHGVAAHAGLEPEKGANAGVELAHQILAIAAMTDPTGRATTVTPTLISGGSSGNTVPALAAVTVDVRVTDQAAQDTVDAGMRALTPRLAGTRLEVTGGPNRPPMAASSSAALFSLAGRVAEELGLGPLSGVAVGGASDGNFSAGAGCPTLDGLGAVGGGAHAADEHLIVDEMPRRAALLAGLVEALLKGRT
ncbi:M20/M25/M40 family metallo-hydrolase [Sphaerisporangium corydalis]|uniref:M20/M25/M40 family metallo-hydrolase n=1 Tax=Sphaerisporangium corydalis TaxID=1441875 RepID=A0ABV9EEH2_9ACTN|nr:M20/M25/M40 family metallo-hydrolase [Sphaerisporangium corydalis]